jgi:type IV pilus assembly protein PilC
MTQTFIWKNEASQGEIQAKNIDFARALLLQKNIRPTSLKKIPLFSMKPAVKKKDATFMLSQLSQLTKSGISIVQSFEIIASNTNNEAIQTLCAAIATSINTGKSLNQSLSQYSTLFNPVTLALIDVAEQTGQLDTILDTVVKQQTKQEELGKKLTKALLYPCIVVITAIIATVILLIFVIPQMQQMYENFDAKLPWITQAVINASSFLQSNLHWIIITLTLSTIVFSKLYKKFEAVQQYLHKQSLRLPKLKDLIQKSSLYLSAQILSIMVAAGIPLPNAIQLLKNTCRHHTYKLAWIHIAQRIETGTPLSDGMKQTHIFPALFLAYIKIGEQSGRLDEMLAQIAALYENELNHLADKLNLLLEPIIMLVLGCIIGTLIVAMYLPLFQLGQVL